MKDLKVYDEYGVIHIVHIQVKIELIKLNGITDEQIEDTLKYLKSQTEISNIDDVDGYDNWNSFFIMFCVKANKSKKS